jgi:hypothetical protein
LITKEPIKWIGGHSIDFLNNFIHFCHRIPGVEPLRRRDVCHPLGAGQLLPEPVAERCPLAHGGHARLLALHFVLFATDVRHRVVAQHFRPRLGHGSARSLLGRGHQLWMDHRIARPQSHCHPRPQVHRLIQSIPPLTNFKLLTFNLLNFSQSSSMFSRKNEIEEINYSLIFLNGSKTGFFSKKKKKCECTEFQLIPFVFLQMPSASLTRNIALIFFRVWSSVFKCKTVDLYFLYSNTTNVPRVFHNIFFFLKNVYPDSLPPQRVNVLLDNSN